MILGVTFFVVSGAHAPTSLIPTFLGGPIFACGLVAQRNELSRKGAMHGAVLFGLLGFLGSLRDAPDWPKILSGQAVKSYYAAWEQFALFLICGIFVILCVRSFIAARQAR